MLVLAAICLLCGAEAQAQSYAITNAKIVTVSGATIDRGTIVIRNGLIDAVGANVTPPADAQVFDATGLTVYPGFIDALTRQPRGSRIDRCRLRDVLSSEKSTLDIQMQQSPGHRDLRPVFSL